MNYQIISKSKWNGLSFITTMLMALACAAESGSPSPTPGRSGSTARFAVHGDYLYTLSVKDLSEGLSTTQPNGPIVKNSSLPIIRSFHIATAEEPQQASETAVIDRPETLFVDGNQLYVGAEIGMQIFAIGSAGELEEKSQMKHLRACDPIVTEQNRAYLTLHGSPSCRGSVNELQVIDIQNPQAPTVLGTLPMNAPYGLAVNAGTAYVCDGPVGLRLIDVKDAKAMREVAAIPEDVCMDVILHENRLISTGFAGVTQYDIQSTPPRKLSTIAAE